MAVAPECYKIDTTNIPCVYNYSVWFDFSGANNVGNLFQMAGQVGKAVGTLVTVMTDDEGSGSDDEDIS